MKNVLRYAAPGSSPALALLLLIASAATFQQNYSLLLQPLDGDIHRAYLFFFLPLYVKTKLDLSKSSIMLLGLGHFKTAVHVKPNLGRHLVYFRNGREAARGQRAFEGRWGKSW